MPKAKTNGDKAPQEKSANMAAKVNGEGSISSATDIKNDKLGTKEPIVNGTDNTCENVVNGDPKKHSDCDISSSDSTKIVTNGINSDSDDTKSSKSDEADVSPNVCPNKVSQEKQISERKKEKKVKSTDKNSDSDKKIDSDKNKKNSDDKKEDDKAKSTENVSDKVNGETGKMMNGDKDRESSPSEDGDEKKRDAEVVFIQDMGFTVKIVSPGAEPLDIQVFS